MQELVQKFLVEQQQSMLLRKRNVIEDGINFTSNDYLGLAKNHEVINAFKNAADLYGIGSGGSVFVCGYTKLHQEAEEKFAEFIGREKALLFSSGYHANLGAITSFADRNTNLFIDRLSHASIIDASILSRANFRRYSHNDIIGIASSIKQRSLICTEGVFSMEGNISDLKSCVKIAKQTDSTLILDDAHALGVIGRRGSIDFHGVKSDDVAVLINPLGKAVGIMGAFVSGTEEYIEFIKQKARSYKYTTALSPAIASAITKSLKIMEKEEWRQQKLTSLIEFFIKSARERGINLVSDDVTPIKSILIPDIKKLLEIQEFLLNQGIFISAIRAPTVPVGSSRIRISLNINHTEENILKLLDILVCEGI